MGDFSKIQWTTHTFNPWIGCHKVSAECKHCYAEVETFARRERARGLELWGVDAARHVTSDANWRKPIAWDRAAEKAGERHRVFCASMADVFEDRPELVKPRRRLWHLIEETPQLDWLILTKRPENADRLACQAVGELLPRNPWPENIWLGTSVGTQATADERIPHLLRVPARVRFLSCEPLLEEVDIRQWTNATCMVDGEEFAGSVEECPVHGDELTSSSPYEHDIDWVIIGGDSGHKARPCDVGWIRGLVEQCKAAGVAAFVKQLGANAVSDPMYSPTGGMASRTRLRFADKKGGDPDEWPEDLRVRQIPNTNPGQAPEKD